MHAPVEELTPRQIVAELDKYIVGQTDAKKAVAVALRNRYRRQQLPPSERDDVMPKNILMMGPTGVGKTEIARRLAQLARAPFIKVEATKFTEVGYVGRDVESMIRELVAASVRLVEMELAEVHEQEAIKRAYEKLVDQLHDPYQWDEKTESYPPDEVIAKERESIMAELKAGKRDEEIIQMDVEEMGTPFLQVFGPQGMEEMGLDSASFPGMGPRRVVRKMKIGEALRFLIEQEAKSIIDQTAIFREAVHRAEQTGIIFLDEIDKIAGKTGGSGPDVSREGVQRDLLPVIEGSTVQSKYGPVRTDHILFIAAGAFHLSKPSDLIPELQGRLPIRVQLEPLSEADFRRILFEPKNALTKQYQQLLAVDGVEISFTPDGLDKLAHYAHEVNAKTDNIGARRLHTIMERLLEDLLFEAPDTSVKSMVFDAAAVEKRIAPIIANLGATKNLL